MVGNKTSLKKPKQFLCASGSMPLKIKPHCSAQPSLSVYCCAVLCYAPLLYMCSASQLFPTSWRLHYEMTVNENAKHGNNTEKS